MKPEVQLVYDPACPHIPAARRALLQAFAIASLPARWTEWRTDAAETPERLRRVGSPTILVHGRDVYSATGAAGPSCRLYGGAGSAAPMPEEIARKLKSRPWRSLGGLASGISGAAALLLPAGLCPACWPAYAAVLASMGAAFLLETAYQAPIAAGLFALAIGLHSYQALRNGRYAALLLGFAGASAAWTGKFVLSAPAIQYVGLFAYLVSVLWTSAGSGRRRRAENRRSISNQPLEDCCGCKEKS